jgi:hypothetical protein
MQRSKPTRHRAKIELTVSGWDYLRSASAEIFKNAYGVCVFLIRKITFLVSRQIRSRYAISLNDNAKSF